MAELRVDKISKVFGETQALADTTWQAQDGALVVILGPTGAGKTTSIRVVAGLDQADAGSVSLDQKEITHETPARRDIAVVFQNFSLYPHLTVAQNLAFPLQAKWRGFSKTQIQERVEFAAKLLHIDQWLERKPSLLSGGQMQRVAIGRAIVRQPRLFLMDEPLTNLDAKLREELRFELKAMQRRLETTTVYVTHDPVEAMSLADQLIVLDAGKILQSGDPANVYAVPQHRRVGELLGVPPMNFLEAHIEAEDVVLTQAPHIKWPLSLINSLTEHNQVTERMQLGVRPEALKIDPSGQLKAEVEVVEFFGADQIALIRLGEARLRLLAEASTKRQAGAECRLYLPESALHVFDTQGQRL